MNKAVIGLSGGMDSATLLSILLEQGYEVHCVMFTYGSKHNKYENKAAMELYNYFKEYGYEVVSHLIDITTIFQSFKSNLLESGGEIPEGHYESKNMKLTVVPGRNLIFASIMAGLAESIEADLIALGVHAGDHAIYPDCRKEFIDSLKTTLARSSDNKVSVYCPFININKIKILEIGINAHPKTPYELTRTCYKNQSLACGKCGSCRERLEAFKELKIKDPIKYE